MSWTVDSFRVRFPEFTLAAYPDLQLDAVLLEALRQINVDVFGARADDAQGYLAAHLLMLSSGRLAAGVQSVSAGQASITYASAAGGDWAATGYGLAYWRLARAAGGARIISGLEP